MVKDHLGNDIKEGDVLFGMMHINRTGKGQVKVCVVCGFSDKSLFVLDQYSLDLLANGYRIKQVRTPISNYRSEDFIIVNDNPSEAVRKIITDYKEYKDALE